MHNLHLSLTKFTNESRVLKQAQSLIEFNIFESIEIICVGEQDGRSYYINDKIHVKHSNLSMKRLPKIKILQIFKYFEFFIFILKNKNKKPTVVSIHSLSLLPIGFLCKMIWKTKLVYDAHELETETFVLKGIHKKFAKLVEMAFIQYTDLVLVVSPGIEKWYKNKYQITHVSTVLNAPRQTEKSAEKSFHELLDLPREKQILLYLGGLVEGRGIPELLTAFSEITDTSWVLVFLGYGHLDKLIEKASIVDSRVRMLSAVRPHEVVPIARTATVGICYLDNGSLNDYHCLPNKFFECLLAGIPVIVSDGPDMAEIVAANDAGVVIQQLTRDTLSAALRACSTLNLSKSFVDNFNRRYGWSSQEKVLVDCYGALFD